MNTQAKTYCLFAIYITTCCVYGRSIRAKREVPIPKHILNLLQWGQRFQHLGTGVIDLNELRENNSTESVDFEPTTIPPPLGGNVVSGSIAEDDEMNEALPGQNQSEILKECRKILDKDLRDICIRVATNPILKTMTGVRAYAAQQSRYTTTRGFASVAGPRLKHSVCKEKLICPVYRTGEQSLFVSRRSLSPWTMCHEFDPNRFPQWLNKAECLCQGCISQVDGMEDIRNVHSQQLSVDIAVLRKDNVVMDFSKCTKETCREGIESIAIGCHCALSKIITTT